jgi:hypothetical protein
MDTSLDAEFVAKSESIIAQLGLKKMQELEYA